MTQYLLLFAIVMGVNLLPAFGPPTWSVIVIYGLSTKMPAVPLVVISALAAAIGRYALAHAFRLIREKVPDKMRQNLEAAGKGIEKRKGGALLGLGLFALSPLPSAQLFETAGLTGVRLFRFTAAFFVGRLASYAIYVATAKNIEKTSMGEAIRHSLTSPLGIGLQILMIGLLVALSRIDWQKHFASPASVELTGGPPGLADMSRSDPLPHCDRTAPGGG